MMVNKNDSAIAVDYKKFRAMNTELNGRLYGLSVRDSRFFIYNGPTKKVIYAGKIIGDGSILAGRIIDYDGPKMPNSQFNRYIEVGINPGNVIDIRDLYNFYVSM